MVAGGAPLTLVNPLTFSQGESENTLYCVVPVPALLTTRDWVTTAVPPAWAKNESDALSTPTVCACSAVAAERMTRELRMYLSFFKREPPTSGQSGREGPAAVRKCTLPAI